MKYRLYESVVPAFIRKRIWDANIRQFEQHERERLRSHEESLAQAELSSVYIANLRVIIDRYALFNAMPKGAIVAQVGARHGDLAAEILLAARPKKLHLLDNWTSDQIDTLQALHRTFGNEIALGQVVVNNGNPSESLSEFDEAYFDWIYLADLTSYESVSLILEICSRKVSPAGIISGKNYTLGSWSDRMLYGVIQAVHEFCKNQAWEMIFLTHEPNRELSFALRKIGPSIRLASLTS
jgi:hypothetical protein